MTIDHDGNVVLTIAQINKRDAGTYSCIATNEVGKAESFAVVKVMAKEEGDENQIEVSEKEKVVTRELP